MPDAVSLIPEIADQDINWIQSLMGLEPFDESRRSFLKQRSTVDLFACPGSGKTTLIVAKLAMLAQKWPHRTKGICVLSHTNVAREQIEHRIGQSVVGQRVLAYPHFVDTIHGFVNRFLALPWLYSNGYPSPTIDDDITTEFRRRVLGRDYFVLKRFLTGKNSSLGNLRISDRNLGFDLSGKPFPAGDSTKSFKSAERAIKASAEAGYFCYDEMFVWAIALLEDFPNLPDWFAHRFPLVIIDEMQDTFEKQTSILSAVFPRTSDKFVIQRIGDPNQEIYDIPDVGVDNGNTYPDSNHKLEIPNSYRFGNGIARLASPFAVEPVGTNGLSGIGPKGHGTTVKDCKHAIFIFPENSTEGVLDAFGKYALNEIDDRLYSEGTVYAVGHVHRNDPEVGPGHQHYPKSVGHYWEAYSPEISSKDPYPRTLVQFVRVAQGLIINGRTLSCGVDKIASGTIELARRIGDIGNLKRKVRTHRTIINALEGDTKSQTIYLNLLKTILVEQTPLRKDDWPCLEKDFTRVAVALCESKTDASKVKDFLVYPSDDSYISLLTDSSGIVEPNVLRVSSNNKTIDIRLGSIHSVKGQTHVATLLLNTFWYGHSAKHIMPWLLGHKFNGINSKTREKQRLLHTYVAMTRPSHLLCLAIPRSALGEGIAVDNKVETLQSKGWRIAEIFDGKVNWRN